MADTPHGETAIAHELKEDVDEKIERHPHGHGIIDEEKEEHAPNHPGMSVKAQLMATLLIVVCAVAGAVLGVVLSNNKADADLISWLGLPGDLFIRALKCVVLPLIFVNVIIAVIQMIDAGKAGAVGKYTVLVYLLTTFIASLEGLMAVLIFQDNFSSKEPDVDPTFFNILCPFDDKVLVQTGSDITCESPDAVDANTTQFELDNENGFFVTTGEEFVSSSFSETLQVGIFKKLISDNIVAEFANGGFVGVVMFAIVFGAAASSLARTPVLLLEFMQDVNDILVRIIEWIILLTPIAVFSLIVGALAAEKDLADTFSDIGVLVGASSVAIFMHLLIVYPGLFYLFTRENPYSYMRHLFPAQIFALSCSSSAATLPMTQRCVTATGLVPDSIRDFVLPIGATVNMDGTALYFPPALIFLSKTAGIDSGFSEIFLIVLVSTIGSAGAAPVPNAGLVLIITAFNTVYGGSGTPDNFALIVAIDWLMDRCQTALNITGDAMVCRIVTKLSGAEVLKGKPTVEEQI